MKGKKEQAVTLIAPGTKVEGDVHFDNQLFVKGEVRGNIIAEKSEAQLIVSPEGLVAGEIKAPQRSDQRSGRRRCSRHSALRVGKRSAS
jgi:cytoskeletal protein CcmA (bactofilin family)